MSKTKKAFIVRNFTDAGTGASFTASTTPDTFPDIEDGAFDNYEAGGLVRKPTPAELKVAEPKATS